MGSGFRPIPSASLTQTQFGVGFGLYNSQSSENGSLANIDSIKKTKKTIECCRFFY
jgi:hypothetical protein